MNTTIVKTIIAAACSATMFGYCSAAPLADGFTKATYYVATNGNDSAEGTSWATAKRTIQAGLNLCTVNGCTVLVGDGVYTNTTDVSLTVGETVYKVPTVAVLNKKTYLKALNRGKAVIEGALSTSHQYGIGPGAHRGVYVQSAGNGSIIEGFTIRNCATVGTDSGVNNDVSNGGGIGTASTAYAVYCTFDNCRAGQGAATCYDVLAFGAACAREVQTLGDGWKFMREESQGQLRYLSQPRMLKWLDFMGRDLMELPPPCLTPERGEPSLLVNNCREDLDERAWQDVAVPHDWGIDYAFLPDMPFLDAYLDVTGPGWYRRHFRIATKPGERVFFECDGAMSHAMVWINGRFVGGWPYGYTPWRVELTPHLKFDADNVLAVRCYVFKDASRWYAGGGLIRECRLVTEADDHIVPGSVQITTPVVTKSEATVRVAWEMTKGGRKEKSFVVANPRLWDVDDPHLYEVEIEGRKFRYGIRTISFHPDERGFQLNGRRVQIRGMCLHHDLGAIGAAFNASAARRRLEKLRECGCNAIRTAHNEPDPRFLDLCDEMGFLVMDEIFDEWSIGKNFNGYATLYERWWERDLRRWIRTDRNHPSVIIWGFGNEIMESRMTDEERILFKKLAAEMVRIIHQEDRTRPATTACDNPKNGFNGYADIVDIFGFNYRPAHYAKFHGQNPAKPFFGSETVCQLSTRGEYYFPVNFRRTAKIYGFPYFDYHGCSYGWVTDKTPDAEWLAQEKTPSAMGEFVWTGFDYLAGTFSSPQLRRHPQSVDPATQKRQEEEVKTFGSVRGGMHTCPTGLFDMAGFEKDEFYLYQSKWRPDLRMCHILPHWNWPEREGKNVPVYVYSTGDEVELFVNDVSQGRRGREKDLWRFVWNDVVYSPGALKAIAYRKGAVWAEATVETTDAASRLEAVPEKPTVAADGKDLGFVTIRVCDAKGRTVPRTRTPVKVTVTGAGEFVAADNGDESDFTAFRSTTRSAFNGLLSVIVRARKGATGEIGIRVESDGLGTATATLEAQ